MTPNGKPLHDPVLLPLPAVCERYSVPRATLRQWAAENRIRMIKVGHRTQLVELASLHRALGLERAA
jgi:hypothetical protein